MKGPSSLEELGKQDLRGRGLASGAYSLAMESAFLYGLPLYWAYSRLVSRAPRDFAQRLGFYPAATRAFTKGSPRIWIHASSVGEACVANAVGDALGRALPDLGLVISSGTFFGRERAQGLFGERAACVFAPLDFKVPIQKALRWFRPDALVLLETELWPQWIFQAGKMGVPVILANGRISPRSINSYLRFQSLFSETLRGVAAFSMISPGDAERIKRMGAPSTRVAVNGNAKFDFLASQARSGAADGIETLLPAQASPVIVAGSTRRGEEEAVLDMFARVRMEHPGATLVLAPRHIERARDLTRLLKNRALEFENLSALLTRQSPVLKTPVLLVDLMGHLLGLYSLADLVFCGGSLAPLGGQNVLEPAAMGKPVLYGPHMEDFAEARDLLESEGGGNTVTDPQDLTRQALELLSDPEKARTMGAKALACVQARRGAAEKHAQVILRFIG